MKKVMLSFILLSFLCGCKSQIDISESSISDYNSNSNQGASSDVSSVLLSPEFFTQNIDDLINNEQSSQKLITQKYKEDTILPDLLYWTRFSDSKSNAYFYSNVAEKYKIECFRETSSTKYAVFKTEENGLLYVFFNEDWEYEGNPSIRFSIYCKKRLSVSDFQSISKGTAIQKVEKIDPIVTATLKPIKHLKKSFYTLHMLTDGAILINYDYDESKQTWVVSEIISSQNNKLELSDKEFDFTILPQDYIK